jgi:hemolysin activation/secretion protein
LSVSPTESQRTIIVTALHLSGQTLFTEAELLAISGFTPEMEVTLAKLHAMVAAITTHYQRHGYFTTRAYLPAQEIVDGVVAITVVEGRYGAITVNNTSVLADAVMVPLVNGLNSGDVIAALPLERRLLLLAELPGVRVESLLVPGTAVGTSDLLIDVTPGRRFRGSVDMDNAGNRYTGRYRFGATLEWNEPAGLGDVASLRGVTSGAGYSYFRAGYRLQAGSATVGGSYSTVAYQLGEEFAPLHANGTAQTLSSFVSYPLLRSRRSTLVVALGYDSKTFQDRLETTATITDRTAQVVTLSLSGEQRDGWGSGGVTGYHVAWSAGNITIQTPAAYAYDAATVHSNGSYNKVAYRLMRQQQLTDSLELSAAVDGQVAFKNLDASEKMALGGMYGVRAYPEGEAFADQGYVATLELRLLLPQLFVSLPGRVHLVALYDTGTVQRNKHPWTTERNERNLSGAGGGIIWAAPDNFLLQAYYAHKLGDDTVLSGPDAPGQFWFQIVKYF